MSTPDPVLSAVNQLEQGMATQSSALAALSIAYNAVTTQQAAALATAQQAAAAASGPRKPWLWMNDVANQVNFFLPWADAGRGASGFYADSGTLQFPYSPTGYPIGTAIHARANLWLLGYPPGAYNVTWKGNAAISFSGQGGVTWKQTGPNSGVLTLPVAGALTGPPNNQSSNVFTFIIVTSSDPANPLDALRIWTPGYGPGTTHEGQMFRDEDLELVRKFGGIRCMGGLKTSNVAVSTEAWASRPTLDSWDWTTGQVPVEALIRRAKEAGRQYLWLSMPAGASDDWLTGCAQLVHDTFHGTVIVEGPDEQWNDEGMIGYTTVNAIANGSNIGAYDGQIVGGKWVPTATGGPWVTDSFTRNARCAADLDAHLANVWAKVYADRPGDCIPVFCGCSANPAWIQAGLSFLVARDGSHPFKAIGIAPYVDHWANNGEYCKPSGPNGTYVLNDIFTAYAACLADTNSPGIPWQLAQHAALAKQFGCILVDYEGGDASLPQLVNGQYTGTDLTTQAQTDPRIATVLYAPLFALCHQYGVAVHCDFVPVGVPDNGSGDWSALPNGYGDVAKNLPRWQALMQESGRSN